MSQCPFWSTNRNIFHCYDECPMKNSADDDGCVFQVYLGNDNDAYKNIGQNLGYEEIFKEDYIINRFKISSNF